METTKNFIVKSETLLLPTFDEPPLPKASRREHISDGEEINILEEQETEH